MENLKNNIKFDYFTKANLLIDNIREIELKIHPDTIVDDYELIMTINEIPEIFDGPYNFFKSEDKIDKKTKVVESDRYPHALERKDDPIKKDEYYYEVYNTGLYRYGCNGWDQWWSSRCEVINDFFDIDINECVVNNCCCAIDKRIEKIIIDKFDLINRPNEKIEIYTFGK